ncbi:MscS Mechanosensitive ion channel [Clostridium sp. DL-VIII]|nr:MscS Mechanosensitive ion channel [Clostridium sp. DL-VIII]
MSGNITDLQKAIGEYKDQFMNLMWLPAIIEIVIKVIFVIIMVYFSIKIGEHLIKKFVEQQVKSNAMLSLDTQRAKTLGEVLKSVLKYSAYFVGIAIIIPMIFKGASFTFASIGGIAVGLGAQSLIKDLINGFFILFENQFGVGDHVTLGNFSGIVKSIGIRSTVIADFNGDVHSIPNGSIIGVTNHSRNDIKFIVDVNISYEEDVKRVIDIIKKTCDEFQEENAEYIDVPLEVIGLTALGLSGVTIRVTGKAKPLMQWKMENELRMAIKLTLDKNEIKTPEISKTVN